MKILRIDKVNLLTLFLAFFLVPVSGSAQFFGRKKSRPMQSALRVDHAVFQGEKKGDARLEVYFQLFNSGLRFKEEDGSYVAKYRIIASIIGKKDRVVLADTIEKKVSVASKRRAVSARNYRTSQLGFELPPGKYKVKLQLFDKSSRKVINREFKTKLKKFKLKDRTLH